MDWSDPRCGAADITAISGGSQQSRERKVGPDATPSHSFPGRVVVVVGEAVVAGRKVASTMYQLVLEPSVRLPCCGPAALDRMSARSEAALPFCTSRRYGTIWLLPALA